MVINTNKLYNYTGVDDSGPLMAYPMRYYILTVTCLLICSNTMVGFFVTTEKI